MGVWGCFMVKDGVGWLDGWWQFVWMGYGDLMMVVLMIGFGDERVVW